MDKMNLLESRHSVRQYLSKKIEDEKRDALNKLTRELNEESGLNIQIFYDEPKCFDSFMAHYGKFKGVENYIAIVGKKEKDLDEKAGYYGEQLVLKAQELGLNTCWVAMTHGKSAAEIGKGEKLAIIISLGYGENNGVAHKSKKISDVSEIIGEKPDYFETGVEAALLAPTAMNQQKFKFIYEDGEVFAKATGGFYSKIDLGIVKYHFEYVTGIKIN